MLSLVTTTLRTEEASSEQREPQAHITLRLDERLVAELKRVAKLNDRSVSAEARQALRDYLREQPR